MAHYPESPPFFAFIFFHFQKENSLFSNLEYNLAGYPHTIKQNFNYLKDAVTALLFNVFQ